jgi:tetratricopeptide (TPR) repeat protein
MKFLLILAVLLLAAGLAGVFVLLFKKISTLVKLSQEIKPEVSLNGKIKEEIKTRISGIKYSSILPEALNWLEKGLRKIRLVILKIDNLFTSWIKNSRKKSETMTIRSRAWMEHHRLRKKEKAQLLEKLDKAEVSENLAKIHQEVAKEEDKAFEEKVEIVKSVDEEEIIEAPIAQPLEQVPEKEEPMEEILVVSEEEKKYIDAITQNPKDIQSYRALCEIYLNQQSYSDARACFRQVLKLVPGDPDATAKLENIKGLRSAKKK